MTIDELRGRATITVEEAAELLGVARGTAYAAARAGQLPTIKLGRRVIVPTARLLALLGIEQEPTP
jgi:excisionase family DNA binding protein